MGYIMGKADGAGEHFHSHVTALSVAPEYRRIGLAGTLMKGLEDVSESKSAFFIDLFVRVSNLVAISMYKQLGYTVYRKVLEYYDGDPDEDAFDMRKALSRDDGSSVIPLKHPIHQDDLASHTFGSQNKYIDPSALFCSYEEESTRYVN